MKKHLIKGLLAILSVGISGCQDEPPAEHIDNDVTIINSLTSMENNRQPIAVISNGPEDKGSFLVAGNVEQSVLFQWLNEGQDNSTDDDYIDQLTIDAPNKNLYVSTFNKHGVSTDTRIVCSYSDYVHISSIERLQNGHYALYGAYKGDLTTGSISISTSTQSAFLAVFNGQEPVWVKNITSTGTVNAGKLFVTGNDCYISGSFSGEISLPNVLASVVDPLTQLPGIKIQITQKYEAPNAMTDGFFARYSALGTGTLTRVVSGQQDDHVQDIEVSDKAIFITGYFTDSTTFPYTTMDTVKLTNPHSPNPVITQVIMRDRALTLEGRHGRDALVASYSLTGEGLWAKKIGGSGSDEGVGLCYTGASKLYVGGNFTSETLTLGAIEFGNQGLQDIFRAYFDPTTGNILSASGIGGSQQDACTGVAHNWLGGAEYREYIYGTYLGQLMIPNYHTLRASDQTDVPQGFVIEAKTDELISAYSCSDGFVPAGIVERSFITPVDGPGALVNNPFYVLGSLNSNQSTMYDYRGDAVLSFRLQNQRVRSVLWKVNDTHAVSEPQP